MNTKNLKAYAPKARRQFMDAVAKRAAHFGIYQDEIAPVSFEGSTAIIEGKAFSKQQGEQRKRLEKQVNEKPLATHKERYDLFIREMAYTWFNRLAALRFMELHDYLEHGFRVLSHPTNKDGAPEILDHATDVADMLELDKAQIIEWQLAGDKQEMLYRELLLGQCHHLHSVMPFLFEAIDDATELLLPDNLTKTDSILKGLVNDIPEEDWQQIEVIGWLYQFYISEHKDAVMGKVVKSEDIPAATQLFTPNWIVKYLVQNSIGRQWLATYPDSSIKAKMEYYIEPAEQTDEVNAQLAAITPSSIDPQSIKALDPAAGSGHILVEIYELLREIYLERGYRLREIPELILTKNIYGLDIDDRAAQLAGFALLMKAREDDRRIFQRVQDGSVKLNVYALQSTEGWDSASLWQALNLDGKAKQGSSGNLFAEEADFQQPTGEYAEYFDLLKYLIVSFEQAKTLGSLIQIDHQYLPTLEQLKAKLQDKLQDTDPAAIAGAEQLLPVVEQAIVLAQKYDAVIANPPYMGSRGINLTLKKFLAVEYKETKADLFSAFIERCNGLTLKNKNTAIMSPNVWLYLNSYEQLREKVSTKNLMQSLIELPHSGFKGATVQICAFVLEKTIQVDYQSSFISLIDINGNDECFSSVLKSRVRKKASSDIHVQKLSKLNTLPKKSFVYWVPDSTIAAFEKFRSLESFADVRKGLATCNDELWLRKWYEVDARKVSNLSKDYRDSRTKWFPITKGGTPRRWFGNNEYVINWQNNGEDLKEFISERYNGASYTKEIRSESFYFKEYLSWSDISSFGNFAVRKTPLGGIISTKGGGIFPKNTSIDVLGAILNSSVSSYLLKVVSPTISSNPGEIASLPIPNLSLTQIERLEKIAQLCVDIAKLDWDFFEFSQEFRRNFLVSSSSRRIATTYENLVNFWQKKCLELKEAEERNNEIAKDIYQLDGSLSVAVELGSLTLLNNVYRFSGDLDSNHLTEYRSQSFVDFISYSIGCMTGRYSLDREGLVFANSSNDGFRELLSEGAYKSFLVDDDGIIPLASEDWLFEDDATARFREFVKTVWGLEHLQENLEFVAESLCLNAIKPKKGESAMETIRRYFSTQFFADHCKMYKKRPIYWLFSSGKEKAFECLVYLHRYNEATLSRMRTEYVTPLMGKYDHQLARKTEEVVEATGTEQRRIEKEIKDLEKKQLELRKFDEELKHYAEMRITLDLDDGVKENYGKFGNLLANVKDIHGKAVK